jgi:hypothetical protein
MKSLVAPAFAILLIGCCGREIRDPLREQAGKKARELWGKLDELKLKAQGGQGLGIGGITPRDVLGALGKPDLWGELVVGGHVFHAYKREQQGGAPPVDLDLDLVDWAYHTRGAQYLVVRFRYGYLAQCGGAEIVWVSYIFPPHQ